MDTGIVSSNIGNWGVPDLIAGRHFINVRSCYQIEGGWGDPSQVTHMDNMHLGNGGNRKEGNNCWGIRCSLGDLNFEGWKITGIVALHTDFEAIEEHVVADLTWGKACCSDGHGNLDVFAWQATS